MIACQPVKSHPNANRQSMPRNQQPQNHVPTLRQSTLTSSFLQTQLTTEQQNKSTIDQLRKLVNELSSKIDVNTNTVTFLKESIVSMHTTVLSNHIQIDESLKRSDTGLNTAAKTIVEQLEKDEQKQSYAKVLDSSSSNQVTRSQSHVIAKQSSENDQSIKKKANASKFKDRPLDSGTSEDTSHNLGEPIVITERRGRHRESNSVSNAPSTKPKFIKSVYISRLQPSVTVDGIKLYLNSRIKELNENQMSIRMLVKQDQDLSELSVISFCIACTEELYAQLGSPSFWPSHIKMRELINEPRKTRNKMVNKLTNGNNPSTVAADLKQTIINESTEQPKNQQGLPVQPTSAASTVTEPMNQTPQA